MSNLQGQHRINSGFKGTFLRTDTLKRTLKLDTEAMFEVLTRKEGNYLCTLWLEVLLKGIRNTSEIMRLEENVINNIGSKIRKAWTLGKLEMEDNGRT